MLAREFAFSFSRPRVAAGPVTIELVNVGEDPHDLVLAREGDSQEVARFDELAPAAIASQTVTLDAGRYRLYCALPGHEPAGMRATLLVE